MSLPDGPKAPPQLQLIQWISRPTHYLEACAQHYGDVFTSHWAGFEPFVILSHPKAVQEIFAADTRLMDSGSANAILKPLLGDYSMILIDGDRHQRQRRLLTPPFHGDRLQTYTRLMGSITEQVMNQRSDGKAFSVRSAMQEISLNVILQTVFGVTEGTRYDRLQSLLPLMLDTLTAPINAAMLFLPFLQQDLGKWSPWGRFVRRQQEVDELLYGEIQERQQTFDASRDDILTLMLAARDEAGQPMTEVELRDELLTLLVAGHETTASALAWAMYWIHSLPTVFAKLTEEISGLGSDLDPATIHKLPYLNAVCQETLRLYPIAMLAFPRVPRVPFQVMGYEFEPGTVLVPCIYLTHHRRDLYPQSKQFRPERFLERTFSPYEYLPFGGGTRRCLGMAFALLEMKLVLAVLLSRYTFALRNDRPILPQRRGLTLAPPNYLKMAVTQTRAPRKQVLFTS